MGRFPVIHEGLDGTTDQSTDPDAELWKGILAKDVQALEQLMVRELDRISKFISRIMGGLGTESDVEEATQDLWMSIWEGVEEFSPARASFRAWINMKAKYIALDYRRKLLRDFMPGALNASGSRENEQTIPIPRVQSLEGLEAILPMPSCNVERTVETGLDVIMLFEAMKGLPPKERIAFSLRHLEGLPIKEIAQQMNLTPKAVEGYLYRARRVLRENLNDKLSFTKP